MRSLLFLLLLAFVANALDGSYRYTSNYLTKGSSLTATVTLDLSLLPSSSFEEKVSGSFYLVQIKEISLADGDGQELEAPMGAGLPFVFLRLEDGSVRAVKAHPDDTLEMKNLKKSIAEAFQFPTSISSPFTSSETGALGVRQVSYEPTPNGLQGSFSLSDFSSFPEGSGLEGGFVKLFGSKTVDRLPFLSVVSTTRFLARSTGGRPVYSQSQSVLEFLGQTYSKPTLTQSEWLAEDLVHELPNTKEESLPNLPALFEEAFSQETNSKAGVMARSVLVTLLNRNRELSFQGVSYLAHSLSSLPSEKLPVAYAILARIKDADAQSLLASQITHANSEEQLSQVMRSLLSLQEPANVIPIIKALQEVQPHQRPEVHENIDLMIGSLCKFVTPEEAEGFLAPYMMLLKSRSEVAQAHALLVLGNAGPNAPIEAMTPFLESSSPAVREAATRMVKPAKEEEEPRHHGHRLPRHSFSGQRPRGPHRKFPHHGPPHNAHPRPDFPEHETPVETLRSKTRVWNDTSNPDYDIVAPYYQRQQDVDRYPVYTASLSAERYGPAFYNLKVGTGSFSGSYGNGCLAGNFKSYNKLYIGTTSFRETRDLGEVEIFVLTFQGTFDSRVYAMINNNVLLDITLGNTCKDEEIIIYAGDLELINYETEFPLDIGNVKINVLSVAGLLFDAEYTICTLIVNPYVELSIKGTVDIIAEARVTATVLGVVRAGLESIAFFNYEIGPSTQLGSRNSTGGTVCEACIGVYYGYQDQFAYLGLFVQRRQGLGWGDKEEFPITEWREPGVPFPAPLAEACSFDGIPAPILIDDRV